MKFRSCLYVLLSGFHVVFAQTASAQLKQVKVSYMDVGFGFMFYQYPESNLFNFQRFAPASQILQSNFQAYETSHDYYNNINSLFVCGMGMQNKKSLKTNFSWRFSFAYGNLRFGKNYYQQNRYTIDTFTNSKGDQIFIDSVVSENIDMVYSNKNLLFDVALIWKTKNPNKLTFYSGIGLIEGGSLQAQTKVRYYKYAYVNHPLPNTSHNNQSNNQSEEVFKNRNTSTIAMYIPFGIDLKLSHTHSFWSQVHLFSESRFRLEQYRIPEIGKELLAGFQTNAGLRISLNQD